MTLNVQRFLRKYSLTDLHERYHIHIKRHPKYNNLVQLKYNQLETPRNKVTNECRGIILDQDDDWKTICHTYSRFFNLGEDHAAEIDWNTAKVYEKLDGSLMQLYYYDGQWHVATSGTPDADCSVPFGNMTFKDLFWKVWNDLGYDMPENTKECYAFELMTPYNFIVVRHQQNKLALHGKRNLEHGHEEHPWSLNNWQIVEQHDLYHSDEIYQMLNEMDGSQQEGFVIVDGAFNRVKMKCEDYVKKHRLVSSLSQRNMLDLVRTNESTEFLTYFPEWKDVHDQIKYKFEDLVVEIENEYNRIKGIKNQKDFAMKAKNSKVSGTLFAIRSGKVASVRESLSTMNIKHLENLLGLKNVL